MARGNGYLIATGQDGVTEHETITCSHCQVVHAIPHRARAEDIGGLCKQCMKAICPKCVDHGICTPWEKQMERMEARQDALRSYGL